MTRYDDAYVNPVRQQQKRLAAVLGKPTTGMILGVLMKEPYLSASDIATRLKITIATAQKYLLEMKDAGLVDSRTRMSPTRPTEEYWLTKEKVMIEVDLKPRKGLADLEKMTSSTLITKELSEIEYIDKDDNNKGVKER